LPIQIVNIKKTRNKHEVGSEKSLLPVAFFFFELLFDLEGGDVFFRNIHFISSAYMELYLRK
jgi:hypothetical protein